MSKSSAGWFSSSKLLTLATSEVAFGDTCLAT